jgi:HEAT repeat protein
LSLSDVDLRTGEQVKDEVSDKELKKVIADFLEMGHVDNIFEMFKQDIRYYGWVGELLDDERFNVRLGIAVLFEELKVHCGDEVLLAIPSLCQVLVEAPPHVRGEAVNVLGIIGSAEALDCVRKALRDDSPQVREVAMDVLEECE